MKDAFHYNLIRFQPDPEAGEFANIGVVVFSPTSKAIAFKLLAAEQQKRVNTFFQPLDSQILVASLLGVETELRRVQKLLPHVMNPKGLYEEIIRPREDIIRYAPTSMIIGENLQDSANQLFSRYVSREYLLAA